MNAFLFEILDAHTDEFIADIRTLFEAYQTSIDTDLCFQQFAEELITLPGDYAPPEGCLLMARLEGRNAGCVALRKLEKGVCEMKRLYVDPQCRGQGVGIRLIQETIARAKEIGYNYMRLDTLPSMVKAISLYQSLGFKDIDAYTHNPESSVRFMQLDLASITIG